MTPALLLLESACLKQHCDPEFERSVVVLELRGSRSVARFVGDFWIDRLLVVSMQTPVGGFGEQEVARRVRGWALKFTRARASRLCPGSPSMCENV
jgi:hypothetical protein